MILYQCRSGDLYRNVEAETTDKAAIAFLWDLYEDGDINDHTLPVDMPVSVKAYDGTDENFTLSHSHELTFWAEPAFE